MARRRQPRHVCQMGVACSIQLLLRSIVYFIALVILTAFGFLPRYAVAGALPYGLTPAQVADDYLAVAFGSTGSSLGLTFAGNVIAKRSQDLVVNVVPMVKPSVPIDPSLQLVKSVATDLARHAGRVTVRTFDRTNLIPFLNYARAEVGGGGQLPDTIFVYLGNPEELSGPIEKSAQNSPSLTQNYSEYLRRQGTALCMETTEGRYPSPKNPTQRQTIGMSIVYVEYGTHTKGCLYRLMMGAFGLSNNLESSVLSLFHPVLRYESPTPLDWLLWRLHTDPNMRPGMTRDEARVEALSIISKLK